MSIEIPSGLQWVSYLVGMEWPAGDEDAMWRIADLWDGSSEQLLALIPELNRVRQKTMSVLVGETAEVAEEQFAQLFDGEFSVDKLADAMAALGELAFDCGTQIEYTKLQILVALGVAAAEIAFALAMAPWTFGASLASVPIIEALTMAAARLLLSQLFKMLLSSLRNALVNTTVKRLVREVTEEAVEEVATSMAEDGGIQAYQMGKGHRDSFEDLDKTLLAAAAGGGTAGLLHRPISRVLGVGSPGGKRGGSNDDGVEGDGGSEGGGDVSVRAWDHVGGALSEYTTDVIAGIVGTVSVNGQLETLSILGGATSSVVTGAITGAGGHNPKVQSLLDSISNMLGLGPPSTAPHPETGHHRWSVGDTGDHDQSLAPPEADPTNPADADLPASSLSTPTPATGHDPGPHTTLDDSPPPPYSPADPSSVDPSKLDVASPYSRNDPTSGDPSPVVSKPDGVLPSGDASSNVSVSPSDSGDPPPYSSTDPMSNVASSQTDPLLSGGRSQSGPLSVVSTPDGALPSTDASSDVSLSQGDPSSVVSKPDGALSSTDTSSTVASSQSDSSLTVSSSGVVSGLDSGDPPPYSSTDPMSNMASVSGDSSTGVSTDSGRLSVVSTADGVLSSGDASSTVASDVASLQTVPSSAVVSLQGDSVLGGRSSVSSGLDTSPSYGGSKPDGPLPSSSSKVDVSSSPPVDARTSPQRASVPVAAPDAVARSSSAAALGRASDVVSGEPVAAVNSVPVAHSGGLHSDVSSVDQSVDPSVVVSGEGEDLSVVSGALRSGDRFGGRRDGAVPSRTFMERFEASDEEQRRAGLLEGWATVVAFDQRRFELVDGSWVRDFEVRLDLVAGVGVGRGAVELVRDRVRGAVDEYLNGRYRLPNGDVLNVSLVFGSVDAHASVRVHAGPDTTQRAFSTGASGSVLAHEVLHFLGLKEGYRVRREGRRPLLRRTVDESGPMGARVVDGDWVLSTDQLAQIDEIAGHGPVRDLPYDGVPILPGQPPVRHDTTSPHHPTPAPGLDRDPAEDVAGVGDREVHLRTVTPDGTVKVTFGHWGREFKRSDTFRVGAKWARQPVRVERVGDVVRVFAVDSGELIGETRLGDKPGYHGLTAQRRHGENRYRVTSRGRVAMHIDGRRYQFYLGWVAGVVSREMVEEDGRRVVRFSRTGSGGGVEVKEFVLVQGRTSYGKKPAGGVEVVAGGEGGSDAEMAGGVGGSDAEMAGGVGGSDAEVAGGVGGSDAEMAGAGGSDAEMAGAGGSDAEMAGAGGVSAASERGGVEDGAGGGDREVHWRTVTADGKVHVAFGHRGPEFKGMGTDLFRVGAKWAGRQVRVERVGDHVRVFAVDSGELIVETRLGRKPGYHGYHGLTVRRRHGENRYRVSPQGKISMRIGERDYHFYLGREWAGEVLREMVEQDGRRVVRFSRTGSGGGVEVQKFVLVQGRTYYGVRDAVRGEVERAGDVVGRPDVGGRVRVSVPGDGWCLLYAVVAGLSPQDWPVGLCGGLDAGVQHGAVVELLRSGRWGAAGVSGSVLGRVAGVLHAMVVEWAATVDVGAMPRDVVEPYRRSPQQMAAFEQWLSRAGDDQVVDWLAGQGVVEVSDPAWLSAQVLRVRYVAERTQELRAQIAGLSEREAGERAASEVAVADRARWGLAEDALGVGSQFEYLRARGALPRVAELDSEGVRAAAREVNVSRGFTAEERAELIQALQQWRAHSTVWDTPHGEMFPALVAHTLGVRLRNVATDGLHDVGPVDTGRVVEVIYNGHNHYDAIVAASGGADVSGERSGALSPPMLGAPIAVSGGGQVLSEGSEASDRVSEEAVVKREPSPVEQSGGGPGVDAWVEGGLLDQARTEFVSAQSAFNVEEGQWEPRAVLTARHAMEPIPGNDLKFLFRDPDRPLEWVHPDYADFDGQADSDPDGRKYVAEKVGVVAVKSAPRTQLHLDNDAHGRSMMRVLRREVQLELGRLIGNSRRGAVVQPTFASTRIKPRILTDHDGLAEHERVLIGRYGLFATGEIPSPLPAGAGSRLAFLGFYAGALLRGGDDEDRVAAVHPSFADYLMFTGGNSSISALGAANSVPFANTALLADLSDYDDARLNAFFASYPVTMTDRHGELRRGKVVALIGVDLTAGQEIRVSYGPDYLRLFQAPRGAVKSEASSAVAGSEVSSPDGRPLTDDNDLEMAEDEDDSEDVMTDARGDRPAAPSP